MARRVDMDKQLLWQKRLASFEDSGLSVTEFCRQENVSPTQFYYWLRRTSQSPGRCNSDRRKASLDAANSDCQSRRIEVFIGDSIRVSLPTDDLTLVSSVLDGLRASKSANAFELVDVVAGQ